MGITCFIWKIRTNYHGHTKRVVKLMCKLTTGIFLEAIMAIWSEGDDQLFTGTDTEHARPARWA